MGRGRADPHGRLAARPSFPPAPQLCPLRRRSTLFSERFAKFVLHLLCPSALPLPLCPAAQITRPVPCLGDSHRAPAALRVT